MSKPLVIFGTGKMAEVISYYAMHECGYAVAAFAVDIEHKQTETFLGKPVIAFEGIKEHYPPAQYDLFVAVGYQDLNQLRETKCAAAKGLGYKLASVISPNANLPTNVVHGDNCFIMPPAIIHPCVKLGNNVFVWSGALIGHHSVIEDNCWFTSNCNIGGNVTMGRNCFVAMNATVSHSVNIGSQCFLGANTLMTKNLENNSMMIEESTKKFRLSSQQFLKFSNFSSL
jgi:sugar O-acyltransferase (sialic acid O-acetyltransferase NeuD family)